MSTSRNRTAEQVLEELFHVQDLLISRSRRNLRPSEDEDPVLATIQSAIQTAEDLIQQYDGSVVVVSGTLHVSQEERDSLEREIEKCNSIWSPIRKLPLEILAEIFQLACEESFNELRDTYRTIPIFPTVPFLLASICSLWRKVVFTTPHIWSLTVTGCCLSVDGSLDECSRPILRMALEKSKPMPLSLKYPESRKDWDEDLLPRLLRCRELTLTGLRVGRSDLSRWLETTPNIEVLEFENPNSRVEDDDGIVDVSKLAPCIRSLRLHNWREDLLFAWESITSLQLSYSQSDHALKLLSLCMNLQVLNVTRATQEPRMTAIAPNSSSTITINLPHLCSLTISVTYPTALLAQLFPVLNTPGLKMLSLTGGRMKHRNSMLLNTRYADLHALLTSNIPYFMQRHSATLSTLILHDCALDTSVLLPILTSVPTLTCFHMHCLSNTSVQGSGRIISLYPAITRGLLPALSETMTGVILPQLQQLDLGLLGDSFEDAEFVDMVQVRWHHMNLKSVQLGVYNRRFDVGLWGSLANLQRLGLKVGVSDMEPGLENPRDIRTVFEGASCENPTSQTLPLPAH